MALYQKIVGIFKNRDCGFITESESRSLVVEDGHLYSKTNIMPISDSYVWSTLKNMEFHDL